MTGNCTSSDRITTSKSGPARPFPTASLNATISPDVISRSAPVRSGNVAVGLLRTKSPSKVTLPPASRLTVSGTSPTDRFSNTTITPGKSPGSTTPRVALRTISPPAVNDAPPASATESPNADAGPSLPLTFEARFRSPTVVILAPVSSLLTTVLPADRDTRLSNEAVPSNNIQPDDNGVTPSLSANAFNSTDPIVPTASTSPTKI